MPTAIEWTPELEQSVLESIESGDTLRQAAQKNGISAALILKKVALSPSFCEQYTRVLELRTEADFAGLMDMVLEEPERGTFGIDSAWVNWKRWQTDQIKWSLSKRNPKKYGEKIAQDVNVSGAIQILSTIPRPAQLEDGKTIDAEIDPE